ncbi:hypothetical protein BX666DRAFT_1380961 [Dichotomocladium elegans]|nr:hypothetical protein BX666DRAFT_1380961 [Dichotomocladium elegans]
MYLERFARTISPGFPAVFMGCSGIVLKMISLVEAHSFSRTVVYLRRKGEEHALCTLTPNICEQVTMELHLSAEDLALTKVVVLGGNRVLCALKFPAKVTKLNISTKAANTGSDAMKILSLCMLVQMTA